MQQLIFSKRILTYFISLAKESHYLPVDANDRSSSRTTCLSHNQKHLVTFAHDSQLINYWRLPSDNTRHRNITAYSCTTPGVHLGEWTTETSVSDDGRFIAVTNKTVTIYGPFESSARLVSSAEVRVWWETELSGVPIFVRDGKDPILSIIGKNEIYVCSSSRRKVLRVMSFKASQTSQFLHGDNQTFMLQVRAEDDLQLTNSQTREKQCWNFTNLLTGHVDKIPLPDILSSDFIRDISQYGNLVLTMKKAGSLATKLSIFSRETKLPLSSLTIEQQLIDAKFYCPNRDEQQLIVLTWNEDRLSAVSTGRFVWHVQILDAYTCAVIQLSSRWILKNVPSC